MTRRQFIKKGSLFVPWTGLILVPTIVRAQQLVTRKRTATASGPAVAYDSRFEDGSASHTSPFNFTSNAPVSGVSGTVGSNSNRVLIGYVGFTTAVASVAMSWDSVAMTQIGTATSGGGFVVYLFGLKNPNTGNKVLATTFGAGSPGIALGAISVYNADQTTGWQNNGSDSGTGTSASSTVTSANGNMAIAGHINENGASTAITSPAVGWIEGDINGNYAQAYNASTTSSTVVAFTWTGSKAWVNYKCDVIKA